VTNFEKITATPAALGAFLASLTVIESPWEEMFHRTFCAGCGKEDCVRCPHERERNDPTWWLSRAVQGGQEVPAERETGKSPPEAGGKGK